MNECSFIYQSDPDPVKQKHRFFHYTLIYSYLPFLKRYDNTRPPCITTLAKEQPG